MIWAVRMLAVLIALAGVVALVGWMLPIKHEASRSAEFSRPPDMVYDLVSNLDSYPAWWPGNAAKVAVVERSPPSRLVTQIVGETAFGGQWVMEIVATAHGSRLTITERGEIYNPIFRALAKFVFGYTSTMESFLAAAQQRLT